jgi:hypothetical protein
MGAKRFPRRQGDGIAPKRGGSENALVEIPETRYATTSDGVHIAYQVLGTAHA